MEKQTTTIITSQEVVIEVSIILSNCMNIKGYLHTPYQYISVAS